MQDNETKWVSQTCEKVISTDLSYDSHLRHIENKISICKKMHSINN